MRRTSTDFSSSEEEEDDKSSLEGEDEYCPSTAASAKNFDFSELDGRIKAAIDELGGSCFVKLNWSSPKDAAWIAFGNSLECKSPQDIYLLLKSSDFIIHDLLYAYEECVDENATPNQRLPATLPINQLVLREWKGNLINPALEFRCFVKEGVLLGISQRDVRNFYPAIQEERELIKQAICQFFYSNVRERFPNPNCKYRLLVS